MTESRRTRVLGVLVLLWLLPSVGFPQSVDNPATFSIFFENDLFGDTDQHYTSGIKLSWMSPDLKSYRDSGRVPDWPQPFVEPVLFFETPRRGEETLVSRNVIASLGHNTGVRHSAMPISLRASAPRFELVGIYRPILVAP